MIAAGTFSTTVWRKLRVLSSSRSARQRSVTSSWVTTQPPPASGWLTTVMNRPSASSRVTRVGLRSTIELISSWAYCCGSVLKKVPAASRRSTSSRTVTPGFTLLAGRPYISM